MGNDTPKAETVMTDWITAAEAAKILGRTRRRVLQLIHEGKLQARKMTPRLWLVYRKSVEDYKATMD
jgi:excisionase family DNA binding protein